MKPGCSWAFIFPVWILIRTAASTADFKWAFTFGSFCQHFFFFFTQVTSPAVFFSREQAFLFIFCSFYLIIHFKVQSDMQHGRETCFEKNKWKEMKVFKRKQCACFTLLCHVGWVSLQNSHLTHWMLEKCHMTPHTLFYNSGKWRVVKVALTWPLWQRDGTETELEVNYCGQCCLRKLQPRAIKFADHSGYKRFS